MPSEPPDADPHVRWCGGRRGEPGAYPIDHETPCVNPCSEVWLDAVSTPVAKSGLTSSAARFVLRAAAVTAAPAVAGLRRGRGSEIPDECQVLAARCCRAVCLSGS